MSWIQPITYDTATPEVKRLLDEKGIETLTRSRKAPYQLKNHVVYDAIEMNAWRMDDEVQRLVGKRYGDLLEYTVSKENGSVICAEYYKQCLIKQGIEPDSYAFQEKEQVVIDFAKAVASGKGNVPANVREGLLKHFTEEQVVVLAGMAIIANGDTLFERIFDLT